MAIGLQPVDLDERPGQLLGLPWGGGLASSQAHDHVLDAHRLARPHPQVADDPIALVEQSDHCDPLGHGSHARLLGGGAGNVDRDWLIALLDLLCAVAARCREQRKGQEGVEPLHAYSGFQAS